MLMNPKSVDLNQKRKLKSASRPFNSLGSRFITAAPCFWHGAAERVVASITAAGKEPDYDLRGRKTTRHLRRRVQDRRRRAGGPDPQDRGGGHPALPGAYALWTVRTGRSVRNLPMRFPSGGTKGMTKPDTPFPKHWLYYIRNLRRISAVVSSSWPAERAQRESPW